MNSMRFRRVFASILLIAMLFNNVVVLADGLKEDEEKLKFTAVFDIFAENGSINFGEQSTEIEITGQDASVGGVLQSDQILASIRNTAQIFIMDLGYTEKEKEIVKKKNCAKPYYIDIDVVKEVYKDGMVKYIGHTDNSVKFILNGKLISEEYNKGNFVINENIYFTLGNKIVVKNDTECVEKEPI